MTYSWRFCEGGMIACSDGVGWTDNDFDNNCDVDDGKVNMKRLAQNSLGPKNHPIQEAFISQFSACELFNSCPYLPILLLINHYRWTYSSTCYIYISQKFRCIYSHNMRLQNMNSQSNAKFECRLPSMAIKTFLGAADAMFWPRVWRAACKLITCLNTSPGDYEPSGMRTICPQVTHNPWTCRAARR